MHAARDLQALNEGDDRSGAALPGDYRGTKSCEPASRQCLGGPFLPPVSLRQFVGGVALYYRHSRAPYSEHDRSADLPSQKDLA